MNKLFPCITSLLFTIVLLNKSADAQSSANDAITTFMEDAKKTENEEDYLTLMKRADATARRAGDLASQARINQDLGNHFFTKNADESIKYLQKAHSQFTSTGNKREATTCLQNIAFAYEEQKHDYENSMKFTKRAITARTEMKDTLQLANMLKYQCFLYAKQHNFAEGKKSADKAMQLFGTKNYKPGLAVTWRDLAILYEEEGNYDSSIAWMKKSLAIWEAPEEKAGADSRIFGISSDLIRIYAKAGQPEDAEFMVYKNEQADASKMNDVDLLKFYKESKDFFSKNKDKEKAKLYREKYNEQRKKMKADGKHVE